LLQRLSSHRSAWRDSAFLPALSGALSDLADANAGKQPTAAVALAVGHRVAVVATSGARLCVFSGASGSDAQVSEVTQSGQHTVCYQEVGLDVASAVSLVLTVGESRLDSRQVIEVAAPHLYQNRCRAASLAVARAVKAQNSIGSFAVASARLDKAREIAFAPATSHGKVGHVAPKVRIQQVLIRYWKGTGVKPTDPVRRKQVSRTLEEAEMMSLDVLDRLAEKGAVFGTICKSASECETALKSRDLAGDLGWLEQKHDVLLKADRNELVVLQDVVRYIVPDTVLVAAFGIQIGEVSDLVTSEIGIHLLWRTG